MEKRLKTPKSFTAQRQYTIENKKIIRAHKLRKLPSLKKRQIVHFSCIFLQIVCKLISKLPILYRRMFCC